MPDEDASSDEYLAHTYRLLRRAAVASVGLTGIVGSVAALNFTINKAWTDTTVSLWIPTLVIFMVLLLSSTCLVYMYLRFKEVRKMASYWQRYATNLKSVVYRLENLAYFDPITGLPNANALARALKETHNEARCLILIDLCGFGRVNKEHGHWKGDEYLREFSRMILDDSRRNEHVYRDRPRVDGQMAAMRPRTPFRSFRRTEGGDEFYILLRGTIIDGLGYLNRLHARSGEFEDMAERVLGSAHPFSFRAGLVALGKDEDPTQPATEKVSDCLRQTMKPGSKYLIDWGRVLEDPQVPQGFDDIRFTEGVAGNILARARTNFSVDE